MIITHMPTKLAVIVALAIAAALAAFYVVYLTVGPADAWKVHIGSGQLEHADAVGSYFSLTAPPRTSGEWFSFTALEIPGVSRGSEDHPFVLSFNARTRTGVNMILTLRTRDGQEYQRRLALAPLKDWVRVALPLESFTSTGTDGSRLESPTLLGREMTFMLSGEIWEEVGLEMTPPVLERMVFSSPSTSLGTGPSPRETSGQGTSLGTGPSTPLGTSEQTPPPTEED